MSDSRSDALVFFGATGDLARRKLLPGLLHLSQAGLLPECRIIGTALEELTDDEFRSFARKACEEFSPRPVSDQDWSAFDHKLSYIPQSAGPRGLANIVAAAEQAPALTAATERDIPDDVLVQLPPEVPQPSLHLSNLDRLAQEVKDMKALPPVKKRRIGFVIDDD